MAFLPFVRIKLKAAKFLGFVENPQTLGEHLKRKRLQANMLQREVAEVLGACHTAYLRWETDQSEPYARYYPAIIAFLGSTPWNTATSRQEQLVQFRRERGLTISEAANRIGVDEGTWGRWEKGIAPIYRKHSQILVALFATPLSKIIN